METEGGLHNTSHMQWLHHVVHVTSNFAAVHALLPMPACAARVIMDSTEIAKWADRCSAQPAPTTGSPNHSTDSSHKPRVCTLFPEGHAQEVDRCDHVARTVSSTGSVTASVFTWLAAAHHLHHSPPPPYSTYAVINTAGGFVGA